MHSWKIEDSEGRLGITPRVGLSGTGNGLKLL